MNRRWFLLGVAGIGLAGCSEAKTGTEEIHFGRDTCTKCGMMISDPHYAAEIRGGDARALKKFDDPGCAVTWLAQQPWAKDSATEVWMMNSSDGTTWLKAADAWYMAGAMTPMNYGFAALSEQSAGALNFEAMQAAVLSKA